MKKILATAALGLIVGACKPAPMDPPANYNNTREDTKVEGIKLDPESALAKLGADLAWKKTTGKTIDGQRVKIAVIGSGVDYTIPDIREAMAVNLGELGENVRNNRVDDDGNGYVDDVLGYDFYSGDGLPYDWNGHDTYTASVIAATARNNSKVVGVAPNAELLVVRYIGPDGDGTGMDAEAALEYAMVNKARIIYFNYPYTGFKPEENQLVIDKIQKAGDQNILVVVPAGNSKNTRVPALIRGISKMDHVLVVGALDSNGKLNENSNFGQDLVTVAATSQHATAFLPGGEVDANLSTTSVAAAITTGAAALISTMPGMGSAQKIRSVLLTKAVDKKAPEGIEVLSGGAVSLAGF